MLTGLSAVTGRAPMWGLSTDIARTMSHSIQADGRRAERELGVEYTDIHTALEDTIRGN